MGRERLTKRSVTRNPNGMATKTHLTGRCQNSTIQFRSTVGANALVMGNFSMLAEARYPGLESE